MRPLKILTALTITLVMAQATHAQSPLHGSKLNRLRSINKSSGVNRNLITQVESSLSNLSALEQEIIQEMNRVRRNPGAYADELVELKQYYNGNELKLPGKEPITTSEGVRAVNDAIEFLRSTNPLPPLTASLGMSLAAKDHVQDQGAAGQTGHTGTDGSTPDQRISRYGTAQTSVAESIAYGNATAEDVVRSLIIDDGLESRGHRRMVFNPDFKFTGVACGEHTRLESMCTITYAREFTDNENLAQMMEAESSEGEEETATTENTENAENAETTATEPEMESVTTENTENTATETETESVNTENTENAETTATEPEAESVTTENTENTATEPEIESATTENTETATETPETTATEQDTENTIAINNSNLISLPFNQNGALETGDSQLPNDSSFYDMYAFQGNAGQSITISLESQEFDTYLFLLDPDNEQIAENDDISENNKNSAITITLPASGTYRVIVNSYDAEGKGNYSLSVNQ